MADKRRGGLGRGLEYLFAESPLTEPASVLEPAKSSIGDEANKNKASKPAQSRASKASDPVESVVYIGLNDIKPNAAQPRKNFDQEALQELGKTGIITIYPQRGTVISELDYDRIREAEFLRRTVECAVIEEACFTATDEDFLWFENNLALQKLYWSNISPIEQSRADKEFHKHLYEITKKMQCYEAVQNLNIHFDRIRYAKFLSKNDVNLYKDHMSIFEAIRERNPQKAIEAEKIHLSVAQVLLL